MDRESITNTSLISNTSLSEHGEINLFIVLFGTIVQLKPFMSATNWMRKHLQQSGKKQFQLAHVSSPYWLTHCPFECMLRQEIALDARPLDDCSWHFAFRFAHCQAALAFCPSSSSFRIMIQYHLTSCSQCQKRWVKTRARARLAS